MGRRDCVCRRRTLPHARRRCDRRARGRHADCQRKAFWYVPPVSEFQAGSEPGSSDPITDTSELVAYVRAGAKPRSEWRVGTEYEKVGVRRDTGAAAPFSGVKGIERVLQRLA